MRKISALVLAVLLLVSVLPMGLLASAETPTSLNEGFESGTVGETPEGWAIISHPNQAGAGVNNYYTPEDKNPNPFDENYKLTVSADCYTGEKALSLKADNGGTNTTFGYVSAQSPAISVEGGKKYYFEYALKTTAITDQVDYYGGRVFVSEFAADGTNLARTMYTQLLPDTDWAAYLQEHTTQANTTTVRLEFYLGGKKDKNIGAEFLVDDVYFSQTKQTLPLDGTFESYGRNSYPKGWTLFSSYNTGGYGTNQYHKNYSVKVVQSDKYSGSQALEITRNDGGGTNGYMLVQSPAIDVKGNTAYVLRVARKLQNIADSSKFFGGRIYVAQHDANGNEVARSMFGTNLINNTDWSLENISVTTEANAAKVYVEFYIGGVINENPGVKILIDDLSFEEPTLDGTFESNTVGEMPWGWKVVSVDQAGGAYRDNLTVFNANYLVTVTNDKFSGQKGLTIAANSGAQKACFGYIVAQTPAIKVKGNTSHKVSYALKTSAITNQKDWFGGQVWVVEYNAQGEQINRQRLQGVIAPDTDWANYGTTYTTSQNAATVKLEFYLGGPNGSNVGAKFYVDDISFEEPKFDGTFESYPAGESLFGWNNLSTNMGGSYDTTTSYQNKYVVSIVTDDKYTGNKALSIAHKDTTGGVYGYFVAQTPKIEVTPGVQYTLKFARKITGVNAVTNFFASRVYVAQYNAEGTQIARGQLGDSLGANCDWTVNTEKITVRQNAAYVVLEFYSGSHRDQNIAATILIDDVDFFTCTNHVYDDDCDEDCNECGATREAPHDYANACDTECDTCFETREAAHNYDNACDAECNECGDVRVVPHAYDDDCDEECNLCHTTRTVTHKYDGECDAECNVCGDTRQVNASHTFANDCDTECDVCHATRQPAADHQYTDACDTDCNVCQAPRTAPHDYDSECDTKCNLCEETRTTTVQHDWDAGTVTKPADCKDNGEKTFTCNDCKETKTEEIDKTGHTLGGWTTVQPAGCENGGTEKRECSKCDYEETRETTALGHNFGEPTVTEPTCTNDGIKETACSRCDEKEIEVLEATGHDYGEWEVTKEATETEKGTKTKTCETCGDKKTEDIPKLAPSTDADTDKDDSESAGFPWYYVAIPAAAVLVLVIVIVVIAKSRKK